MDSSTYFIISFNRKKIINISEKSNISPKSNYLLERYNESITPFKLRSQISINQYKIMMIFYESIMSTDN